MAEDIDRPRGPKYYGIGEMTQPNGNPTARITRNFKTREEAGDLPVVEVSKKDKSTFFQYSCPSLSGMLLTNIEIGKSKIEGKEIEKGQWKFFMVDADSGEECCLALQFRSSYARSLLNQLAAVKDFTEKFRVLPWKMVNENDKDKFWRGVTLYRGPNYTKEDKVTPKYNRDELPAMKEVKFKGEVQWDDEELMNFWEREVHERILPRIKKAITQAGLPSAAQHREVVERHDEIEPPRTHDEADEFDDVPF